VHRRGAGRRRALKWSVVWGTSVTTWRLAWRIVWRIFWRIFELKNIRKNRLFT
jgi:hypothetical protein